MATISFIEFIENYFGVKAEEFNVDFLYRMGLDDNGVKKLNAHIGVTKCANIGDLYSLIIALIIVEAKCAATYDGDNVSLSWQTPNNKLVELQLPAVAVLEQ